MVFFSHAMSYPISGLVREFMSKGYDDDHPMVVCIYDLFYFFFFVSCLTLIMNTITCTDFLFFIINIFGACRNRTSLWHMNKVCHKFVVNKNKKRLLDFGHRHKVHVPLFTVFSFSPTACPSSSLPLRCLSSQPLPVQSATYKLPLFWVISLLSVSFSLLFPEYVKSLTITAYLISIKCYIYYHVSQFWFKYSSKI